MKYLLRFGFGLAVALVIALSAVWTSFRRQEKLEHFYERVVFQVIADRVTQGAPDAQSALVRILDYVHPRVVLPSNDRPVGDVEPLEILAAGRGWCDQSANVFAQMVRTLPLDVRLVFLRTENGRSPHSIAEVYLDGQWRVVDPFVGMPIFSRDGKLATRREIGEDPDLLSDIPNKEQMASWYKQEPILFNTWHGKRKAWLDHCPKPVRKTLLCAIQEFYFQLPIATRGLSPEQRLLKRARHYTFLRRTRAAERLFNRLRAQSKDESVRQDAGYFLARYYKHLGRFDEALKLFDLSLKEKTVTSWRPYIFLSMGKIYESLRRPEEALTAYQRSTLITADAFVAKRVSQLQKNR